MSFTVTEYCDVASKAKEFELNIPSELAILPRNFDSAKSKNELYHESSTTTFRTLFRQHNIIETKLEKEQEKFPSIQENEFAFLAPVIFVSSLALTQNPHALSAAINIISNYATDFFKGIPGRKKIKLDVVVEEQGKKRYKKIHYEGNPEGLKDINDIVGKVFKNEG